MRGCGHPRDSNAVEGERGLSKQPAGRSGDAAARQSQLVRVLTGGAGHIGNESYGASNSTGQCGCVEFERTGRRFSKATTKGLTGILHVCNLSKQCVGAGLMPAPISGRNASARGACLF